MGSKELTPEETMELKYLNTLIDTYEALVRDLKNKRNQIITGIQEGNNNE